MTLARSLTRITHSPASLARSLTACYARAAVRLLARSLASGKVVTYERPVMRRFKRIQTIVHSLLETRVHLTRKKEKKNDKHHSYTARVYRAFTTLCLVPP